MSSLTLRIEDLFSDPLDQPASKSVSAGDKQQAEHASLSKVISTKPAKIVILRIMHNPKGDYHTPTDILPQDDAADTSHRIDGGSLSNEKPSSASLSLDRTIRRKRRRTGKNCESGNPKWHYLSPRRGRRLNCSHY